MSTITCKDCKTQVHPMEVFPGSRCIDCHSIQFDKESDPRKGYDEMMQNFKGGIINK